MKRPTRIFLANDTTHTTHAGCMAVMDTVRELLSGQIDAVSLANKSVLGECCNMHTFLEQITNWVRKPT